MGTATDFRVQCVSRYDLANLVSRVARLGWWTVGAMQIWITESGELLYSHSQHPMPDEYTLPGCHINRPTPAIVRIGLVPAEDKCEIDALEWKKLLRIVGKYLLIPRMRSEETRDMQVGRQTQIEIVSAMQMAKPGPPKKFPHRLEVRYGEAEKAALETLSERTGEEKSEIVRRLIREADGNH